MVKESNVRETSIKKRRKTSGNAADGDQETDVYKVSVYL